MSSAKLAVACGLAAVALSACGIAAKPVAGTIAPGATSAGRARVDDPRTTKTNYLKCLRQDHLQVTEVGKDGLQVGSLPAGPTIVFEPTPGITEGLQIQGVAQARGAEVISSELLYPHGGSDKELKKIETCLDTGVKG